MRAPSPERLSVYGALHLAAATAAAASFDRATETALATARDIADRTGEANHMGTAFGPVNVAIHAISASLSSATPGRRPRPARRSTRRHARRPGGQAHPGEPRPGPRVRHDRKDAAAVNLLLAAERLSPQLVRYDRPPGTS